MLRASEWPRFIVWSGLTFREDRQVPIDALINSWMGADKSANEIDQLVARNLRSWNFVLLIIGHTSPDRVDELLETYRYDFETVSQYMDFRRGYRSRPGPTQPIPLAFPPKDAVIDMDLVEVACQSHFKLQQDLTLISPLYPVARLGMANYFDLDFQPSRRPKRLKETPQSYPQSLGAYLDGWVSFLTAFSKVSVAVLNSSTDRGANAFSRALRRHFLDFVDEDGDQIASEFVNWARRLVSDLASQSVNVYGGLSRITEDGRPSLDPIIATKSLMDFPDENFARAYFKPTITF